MIDPDIIRINGIQNIQRSQSRLKDFAENELANELVVLKYRKLLIEIISMKRYLMAWNVSKTITSDKKKEIRDFLSYFQQDVKTRHFKILSFIRTNIKEVSPSVNKVLLQVKRCTEKTVRACDQLSNKKEVL